MSVNPRWKVRGCRSPRRSGRSTWDAGIDPTSRKDADDGLGSTHEVWDARTSIGNEGFFRHPRFGYATAAGKRVSVVPSLWLGKTPPNPLEGSGNGVRTGVGDFHVSVGTPVLGDDSTVGRKRVSVFGIRARRKLRGDSNPRPRIQSPRWLTATPRSCEEMEVGTEVVETPLAVLETAALPLGYVPDGFWREGEDSNLRDPYIIRFQGGRLGPDSATFPFWSRQRGSNPRPAVYETAAPPLCYVGRGSGGRT